MYRLMGLDLETTSLKPEEGKIVEMGIVVKDYGEVRPLVVKNEYIYDETYGSGFIPEAAKKIHLIADTIAEQFGVPLASFMKQVATIAHEHEVDYIVAHNGAKFDKPYLEYHCKGLELGNFWDIPWIDTRTDIDWETRGTEKLEFLCAQHGFLNPFPHVAFSDVFTMLKLLDLYEIEQVVRNASTPRITVRAVVSYDDRNKAKAAGYFWNAEAKQWHKNIRVDDMDKETALGFKVVKVPEKPNLQVVQ